MAAVQAVEPLGEVGEEPHLCRLRRELGCVEDAREVLPDDQLGDERTGFSFEREVTVQPTEDRDLEAGLLAGPIGAHPPPVTLGIDRDPRQPEAVHLLRHDDRRVRLAGTTNGEESERFCDRGLGKIEVNTDVEDSSHQINLPARCDQTPEAPAALKLARGPGQTPAPRDVRTRCSDPPSSPSRCTREVRASPTRSSVQGCSDCPPR